MTDINDSAQTEPIQPAPTQPSVATPNRRAAMIVGGAVLAAVLLIGVFVSGVAVGSHFGGRGDFRGIAATQQGQTWGQRGYGDQSAAQGQMTAPQDGQGGFGGGRRGGRGGFPGSGVPTGTVAPTQ